MELRVNNNYTEVISYIEKEKNIINKICTFNHTFFMYRWVCKKCNSFIVWKGKKPHCFKCGGEKRWGTIHKKLRADIKYLEYFKDSEFPTGLLCRIIPELHKNDVFPMLTTSVVREQGKELINKLPKLRYYQHEPVELALAKMRGIIELPTRSGKTFVAVEIVSKLGLPTLIIVPDLYLLHQMYDVFRENIDERLIGIIGDGIFEPSFINISTIQTLNSRFENEEVQKILKDTKVLIMDEAHHINFAKKGYEVEEYNTWMKVALSTNAIYRYGLTATPGNKNDIERCLLEAVTGNIIYSIPLARLIEEGYIAQAKVEIVEFEHRDPVWKDWQKAQRIGLVENDERNTLISVLVVQEAEQDKTVFVSVNQIKHAKLLLKLIPDAIYLDGKSKAGTRKDFLDEFQSRKNQILISTLFKEGVDINFDTIIIGAGYKKERDTIQRANRVLTSGKEVGTIIDIYDKDNGILERHSKERIRVYKKQKFPIERR